MKSNGQDLTPVELKDVSITKKQDDTFLIKAEGTTSTGGWTSSLSPNIYIVEPEDWHIAAEAHAPHGLMHNDLVSHWEASITMRLDKKVEKITVFGKNHITKDVPH